MEPLALARLYSGVRNTSYQMEGTDPGAPYRELMAKMPWELHPRKALKYLNASSSSGVGLFGWSLYDVTGALRLDNLGLSQVGSHRKGVRYVPGDGPILAWTEGSGPGNATCRVVDSQTDNGVSELMGAMAEGQMHALTFGDVEQAQTLSEILGLLSQLISSVKPGSIAFPMLQRTAEQTSTHKLMV